jgi:hypothetical protein
MDQKDPLHEAEDVDDDDDDESGVGGGLGALFDSCSAKICMRFEFPLAPASTATSTQSITLYTIGEDPGHLQSGHYLWPAASAAADLLCTNWARLSELVRDLPSNAVDGAPEVSNLSLSDDSDSGNGSVFISASENNSYSNSNSNNYNDSNSSRSESSIRRVLELGSGCGLAGLMASRQLGVCTVVLTDYDAGCLDLLRLNVEKNCPVGALRSPFPGAEAHESLEIGVEFLRWGSQLPNDWGVFDLIVGSDLLYCIGVVEPLLDTVAHFLATSLHAAGGMGSGGLFVLVSSFEIGEDIEREVVRCAAKVGLVAHESVALDVQHKVSRVQYFRQVQSGN